MIIKEKKLKVIICFSSTILSFSYKYIIIILFPYYDNFETSNHLFFKCNIAQLIWVWVRISLRWDRRPTSLNDFQELMGIGEMVVKENSLAIVILAAVVWSSWKARNDWVFNNLLVKSVKAISYKAVGFLTQWTRLRKENRHRWRTLS